ncbi:MAG: YdcF family protein [Eubacteriales bacterium]|nr:YdcF family protein [Eubacteriales bacterium]
MESVCFILGILCLVYYGVILKYAGNSSNFIKIWAALGGGFLCAFLFFYMRENYGFFAEMIIPEFLKVIIAVVAAAGAVLFFCVEWQIFRAMRRKPDQGLDYIIVLGAHVKGSIPSRALYKRLYCAEKYLKENPATRAVLSGGQGKGEEISEAEAMRRYLEKSGIDSRRIFLENRSVNTKENLQFSMEIIQNFNVSIGVVTNDFHVFRGVSIGKKLGCRKIQGIPAKGDIVMELNYLVREFFAVVKDKIAGNI